MQEFESKKARTLILEGKAPNGMKVIGGLDLSGTAITKLPVDLETGDLNLSNCTSLCELPAKLKARQLNLTNCSSLKTLPADINVQYRLDLTNCFGLETLPEGLTVSNLILRNCASLVALPEGLTAFFLDISGCNALGGWPAEAWLSYGRLTARNCSWLTDLPAWLTQIDELDLRGCRGLRQLPEDLKIGGWVDLADTRVKTLPASLDGVELRWRGARVDKRVVFNPETITPQEVLDESNMERRRVLLERLGYEAFLAGVNAEVLDKDSDPGGERMLLKVPMGRDEPLVCVAVYCPSTGRQYVIRVPPKMRSCHQAAAWIAGFDNPGAYRPIKET